MSTNLYQALRQRTVQLHASLQPKLAQGKAAFTVGRAPAVALVVAGAASWKVSPALTGTIGVLLTLLAVAHAVVTWSLATYFARGSFPAMTERERRSIGDVWAMKSLMDSRAGLLASTFLFGGTLPPTIAWLLDYQAQEIYNFLVQLMTPFLILTNFVVSVLGSKRLLVRALLRAMQPVAKPRG